MRSIRVSGLTALASALALAVTAIPFSGFASGPIAAAPQSATVVQAAGSPAPAGVLTLRTTSSTGFVEWNGLRQEFTSGQQCEIRPTPSTAKLLDLRGFVGSQEESAGFRNSDIGVFEPGADGTPLNAAQCARVDAGSFTTNETLVLRLGDDAEDAFGDLVATQATVSLFRNSRSGTIRVTLVEADGTPRTLTPPITWQGGQPGSQIRTDPFTVPSGVFTEIRLTADVGSFSLREAALTLASTADAIFCTDGNAGGTYTNDEGVKVIHLGNADGSACTAFGIRLGSDADAQVWFTKPLDVDPDAQFIFEVPWDTVPLPDPIAPATLTLGSALPPAFIDFEVPAPDGPTEHEMGYCPDYLFNDLGELVGMPEVDSEGYDDARADLDSRDMEPEVAGVLQTVGTQFACIGDRDAQVVKAAGDGYDVMTTDLIYLIGDARMLR